MFACDTSSPMIDRDQYQQLAVKSFGHSSLCFSIVLNTIRLTLDKMLFVRKLYAD